jgi:rubrerythrin
MKADFEVMDALIASLYEELSNISYGWLEAQRMLNKLEFQYELLKKEHKQSVEAVPVKHGKWTVTPVYIKCSECGKSFMLIPQNYCPNCGARMDAE